MSTRGRTYSCGSCAHTDLAILSFHPVKTITTGEGGAVLTNDDALAGRAQEPCQSRRGERPLKICQIRHVDSTRPDSPLWYYEMQDLGFNARITDIQCALGLSQLKRLGAFKARRQEIVRMYNRAFSGLAERAG